MSLEPEGVGNSEGVLRDTVWLAGGTVLSGLAAYGYVILGTRVLGPVAFAPISVLWTFWAVSAAVLTFPVMHWVIRTMEADQDEGSIRSGLPAVLGVAITMSAITGLLAWWGREAFFQQDGVLFPLLAGAIPFGSVAMGLTRGALAGRQRFAAAGVAIAAENLIRVVVGGLVLAIGGGQGTFAGVLVVGFLAASIWPTAMRFGAGGEPRNHPRPLGFLGGIAGGSLIAQIIITGGPAVLAALGSSPVNITGLFATLALFRAPYLVATGVAARITGRLTRLHVDGQHDRLRQMWRAGIGAAALGGPLAGAFGALVGPRLVLIVFGSEVVVSRHVAAVVAAGSGLALIALFYTLILVSSARTALLTGAWMIGLVVAGGWSLLGPGNPVERVAWAFCLAEVATITTMVLSGATRPRRR